MTRRQLFAAAALPALSIPAVVVAHTKEEGGYFYPGIARSFHSVFYSNGWAWDTYLAKHGINGGWRPSTYRPGLEVG